MVKGAFTVHPQMVPFSDVGRAPSPTKPCQPAYSASAVAEWVADSPHRGSHRKRQLRGRFPGPRGARETGEEAGSRTLQVGREVYITATGEGEGGRQSGSQAVRPVTY